MKTSPVLYLSLLHLNTRSPEVIEDLNDVQKMHQRTLTVFGDILGLSVGREAHGVLWRTDTNNAGTTLVVQSVTLPNWTRLPEDYCVRRPKVGDISALQRVLRPGNTLPYRIAANATHTKRPASGARQPLLRRREQIEWLRHAATYSGFRLVDIPLVDRPPKLTGVRFKGRKRTELTVQPIRYNGTLTITDPDAFWATLVEGIGPAKAYGCGMLSLGNAKS